MDNIFKRASKAFDRYDKIKSEIRVLERELTGLCREYDMATGCRATRIESLRQRVYDRRGRHAA